MIENDFFCEVSDDSDCSGLLSSYAALNSNEFSNRNKMEKYSKNRKIKSSEFKDSFNLDKAEIIIIK